jgi:hypothetical protein
VRSGVAAIAFVVMLWPQAGADPPVPFLIDEVAREANGDVTLHWTAETNGYGNLFFTVEGKDSLAAPFATLSPPIPDTGEFSFTDGTFNSSEKAFYNVAAETAYTDLDEPGAFRARAAGEVGGMSTVGYAGAIFDGRYVYFVPSKDQAGLHGHVMRLDTHGDFDAPESWMAYDAATTGEGGATGYLGGTFDGRYVYFAPQGGPVHGKVLRHDTSGDFLSSASWSMHDAGATDGMTARGFQGAVFDGRHVYFVPHNNGVGSGWNGIVLRYDTRALFEEPASWEAWDAGSTGGQSTKGYSSAVFDGRHVYFIPNFDGARHGRVLRFDTFGEFKTKSSWTVYDAGHTDGLDTTGYKGGIFDGRYVYFVPYVPPSSGHCNVLRYDTTGDFADSSSWDAFNASRTDGLATEGYHGAAFDGRRVIFVPYQGASFHGRVLAYDVAGEFESTRSWSALDAAVTDGLATQGYVGAAFDGRYVYFAPYRLPGGAAPFHGNVLRFDARLPRELPPTTQGGSTL